MSTHPSYQLSVLKELLGQDEKEIHEIYKVFVDSIHSTIQQVNDYIEDKQYIKASHVLHRIKSSLKLINAQEALFCLKEIENNIKKIPVPEKELTLSVDKFNRELKNLAACLENELKKN